MVARKATICIFLFSLTVVAPTLYAHNATIGEYWQKRAEEARKAALDAYHPNPFEVTHHLNLHVHRALEEATNSTRRILKKNDGPCEATNPIDRCWRCDPYWANNRKKLADCVLGFGRNAKGGQAGRIYTVTDASDDPMDPKPGTLRHAVIQKEPLWIIFSRSMIIRLKQELILTSYKTIDGRGAAVHIAYGAGITVQFVRNVIIHGLYIHDIVAANGGEIRDSVDHIGIRTASDGDGISVFGSVDVWIDHISMYNCTDGLIDVIEASTAITISNCHMTDHNDVMLFGASDAFADDKVMQITVAFNHFGKGLVQRMPRCRWGFVHVVNNDYTHWLMYAIGGSRSPTIISQGNRFIAPPNDRAKEVTKREYTAEAEWKNWLWKSENDMMVNGAFFVRSGNQKQTLSFSKNDMITAKPATFVRRLTRFSGAIPCTVDKPC